jgi:hypothetical protein
MRHSLQLSYRILLPPQQFDCRIRPITRRESEYRPTQSCCRSVSDRAACSAGGRAPMRTGTIRAPATPVVDAEPATARPFVVELSTSVFTHLSIVHNVCLSVVCCLVLWCMRCDRFKSRRKTESKPLLSCGDGEDPWEAEDLIVQIGVPAREFVRISTTPPCSGVWKRAHRATRLPTKPRRGRWRMARRRITLGSLWAASYP